MSLSIKNYKKFLFFTILANLELKAPMQGNSTPPGSPINREPITQLTIPESMQRENRARKINNIRAIKPKALQFDTEDESLEKAPEKAIATSPTSPVNREPITKLTTPKIIDLKNKPQKQVEFKLPPERSSTPKSIRNLRRSYPELRVCYRRKILATREDDLGYLMSLFTEALDRRKLNCKDEENFKQTLSNLDLPQDILQYTKSLPENLGNSMLSTLEYYFGSRFIITVEDLVSLEKAFFDCLKLNHKITYFKIIIDHAKKNFVENKVVLQQLKQKYANLLAEYGNAQEIARQICSQITTIRALNPKRSDVIVMYWFDMDIQVNPFLPSEKWIKRHREAYGDECRKRYYPPLIAEDNTIETNALTKEEQKKEQAVLERKALKGKDRAEDSCICRPNAVAHLEEWQAMRQNLDHNNSSQITDDFLRIKTQEKI